MSQFDFFENEVLVFQFVITDSTTIERDYEKNGKLDTEEIIYFTEKLKGKKVVTRYYEDHYSIDNEIEMVSTQFYLDGKLKNWIKWINKENEKGKDRSEEKSYLQNGDLHQYSYLKNGTKYIETYEQKQLKEKQYKTDEVLYTEIYQNKKLHQKIETCEISGGQETRIYNSSGKLIDKYNSWYPTSF